MQHKPLKRENIQEGLKETRFRNIILVDMVDSTNELAKRQLLKGAEDGTLIIAEEQTSGKGRMGRRWFSKKYANLLFSIILRPGLSKDCIFRLNMALALSFIEAMDGLIGIYAMIKWPNDIYVKNKKLAGILTEFFLEGEGIKQVIIGMGINVNWAPDDKELLYPVTSLCIEKGRYVDRESLLVEGLKKFDKYYTDVLNNTIEELYIKWNRRCMVIGKKVSVIRDDKELEGIAIRIERDGSLILLSNGEEKRILYGDVSLR